MPAVPAIGLEHVLSYGILNRVSRINSATASLSFTLRHFFLKQLAQLLSFVSLVKKMTKANDISDENALIQDAFREEYRPKCALRRDTKRRLEYPRRGTAIPSGHSVPGLGATSILKFTDFPTVHLVLTSPRLLFWKGL
jgi:hypothetical protein